MAFSRNKPQEGVAINETTTEGDWKNYYLPVFGPALYINSVRPAHFIAFPLVLTVNLTGESI